VRLETFGSPFIGWIKVTVDPDDPQVFASTALHATCDGESIADRHPHATARNSTPTPFIYSVRGNSLVSVGVAVLHLVRSGRTHVLHRAFEPQPLAGERMGCRRPPRRSSVMSVTV
jgi:hypothetical protein